MSILRYLMVLMCCLAVNTLIAQEDFDGLSESENYRYFDLVVTRDSKDSLVFSNGNEQAGYLRKPGNGEKAYFIFTTLRYIGVRNGDLNVDPQVKINKDCGGPFELVKGENNFVERDKLYSIDKSQIHCLKDVKQLSGSPKEFKLVDKNTKRNYTFKIANTEDWSSCSLELECTIYRNGKDTTLTVSLKEDLDTLRFFEGDTLKNIKVSRNRRGLLGKIKINGSSAGSFNFNRASDNESEDDIAFANCSCIREESLPVAKLESICIPISYIKCNQLEKVNYNVPFKVTKVEDSSLCCGSKFWWICFVGLFILIISVYLLTKRYKLLTSRFKSKRQKQGVGAPIEQDQSPSIPSKKDQVNNEYHPSGQSQPSVLSDGKPHEDVNNEGGKTKQVFEKISDHDAASILSDYLNKQCKSIEELQTALDKKWIDKFIDFWNKELVSEHKEYLKTFDKSQHSKKFIIYGITELIEFFKKQLAQEQQRNSNAQQTSAEMVTQQKDHELECWLNNVIQLFSEQGFCKTEGACSTLEEKQNQVIKWVKDLRSQSLAAEKNKDIEKPNADCGVLVEKLKDAHCAEIEELNADYRAKIKELKDAHRAEIKELKDAHCAEVEKLKDAHRAEDEKLEDAHRAEVEKLKDTHHVEVEKLNQSQQMLSAKKKEQENYFLKDVKDCMGQIRQELDNLLQNASLISGENSQYTNSIYKVKENFDRFMCAVTTLEESDEWNSEQRSFESMHRELMECFQEGLNASGWVNTLHYLNLYAGATEHLNDLFKNNGIYPAKLSVLVGRTQQLAGMLGVTIILPHLLNDEFDEAYFEYENGDRWIQTFDSEVSVLDGRIWDITRVGYQLKGGKYRKPIVFYP